MTQEFINKVKSAFEGSGADVLFFTSDGQGFHTPNACHNHAKSLEREGGNGSYVKIFSDQVDSLVVAEEAEVTPLVEEKPIVEEAPTVEEAPVDSNPSKKSPKKATKSSN